MTTSPKELLELLSSAELDTLWRRQSPQLLKELHLLTRDGELNQDARRKLKQIYHLTRFLLPMLQASFEKEENPLLMDMGAGKSYLGFLLYDLWFSKVGRGQVIGLENRAELVEKSKALAQSLGFDRLSFEGGTIRAAPLRPHAMLVALHACDTATDDAILFALKAKTRFLALVPCCQAEVAKELGNIPKAPYSQLWRKALHAREFGSHLTNVLRCLVLESQGYKVTVTEFTGWEHSLKNELVLAEKIQLTNPPAERALEAFKKEFPIETTLTRGLLEISQTS